MSTAVLQAAPSASSSKPAVSVTLASLALLLAMVGSLPSAAQPIPRQLPQASPGATYAAQLAIPPGLGYPFAKCELQGRAPRWLKLDCARLQLTGAVPSAQSGDSAFDMTLRLEDNAGNARSFPLSLRISASPQVVSLAGPSAPQIPSAGTEGGLDLPASGKTAVPAEAAPTNSGQGPGQSGSAPSGSSLARSEPPTDPGAAAGLMSEAAAQLRPASIRNVPRRASKSARPNVAQAAPKSLHADLSPAPTCSATAPKPGDAASEEDKAAIASLAAAVADCSMSKNAAKCKGDFADETDKNKPTGLKFEIPKVVASLNECAQNGSAKDAKGTEQPLSSDAKAWYAGRAGIWQRIADDIAGHGTSVDAGTYIPPAFLVAVVEDPSATLEAPVSAPSCAGDALDACIALSALRQLPSHACPARAPKGTKAAEDAKEACASAKERYREAIDSAKAASQALSDDAANAPSSITVAAKSALQAGAQRWADLACDLQANLDAFKSGSYKVPGGGSPPVGLAGCNQSSPYFRTVLGGNYSAASSTDPQFKLVADVTVDLPLGSEKKKEGLANSQYSWLWGYARVGSISKQVSVIDPSQIVSDYASLAGAQPSQIVQSFEMNVGYALQFHPWRGNMTYFDHGSFSLIAGGGALTPLSPSQAPPQTFTAAQTTINYADGTPRWTLNPAVNCTSGAPPCYISFAPEDRSRFFSFYEGGLRVKLYSSPQYLQSSPFPAIFDVTFGQNEYVTGGQMKGVVMHFGGSTPISPIPGLYAFGSMDVGIKNNADKPIGAVLTPFTGSIPTGIQPYQVIQPPPNRDRYSLGFGIDILQLLRTHQLQDAFNKK